MKILGASILIILCVSVGIAQVDSKERPSEARRVGSAVVGYYPKSDKSRVMMTVGTLLDTSTAARPLFKGAQKIDLILTYEFTGKQMKAKPSAINFAFASAAGRPPRFNADPQRQFRLLIDDKVPFSGVARLAISIPTDLVTYEDIEIEVPIEFCRQLLGASSSAGFQIGSLTLHLTREDLSKIESFLAALALLSPIS